MEVMERKGEPQTDFLGYATVCHLFSFEEVSGESVLEIKNASLHGDLIGGTTCMVTFKLI